MTPAQKQNQRRKERAISDPEYAKKRNDYQSARGWRSRHRAEFDAIVAPLVASFEDPALSGLFDPGAAWHLHAREARNVLVREYAATLSNPRHRDLLLAYIGDIPISEYEEGRLVVYRALAAFRARHAPTQAAE